MILQYIKNVYITFSDSGHQHPRVKTGSALAKAGLKKIVLKKVMSSLKRTPTLPPGTKPLDNQVAGHQNTDGKIGCLLHEDGTVLKPVQYPPKGQREVEFYQEVFADQMSDDKVLLQLRDLVPKFHGMVHSPKESDARFMKLENLLLDMKHPCVLDIKMGRKTYDPLASQEKIAMEIAKFPPAKNIGYQISGMQTYSPSTGKAQKFDKYFCKNLNEESIVFQGFGKFFSLDGVLQKEVIKAVIVGLKEILEWFNKQRTFHFYASSILIVFDGDASSPLSFRTSTSSSGLKGSVAENCCNGDTDSIIENDFSNVISSDFVDTMTYSQSEAVNPKVQVRMIDFAHVYHMPEEDENYIFGLKHLIDDLHRLLKS
ncbi:inositol polyphosphate multikinase-like isoform X1 [Saccostrea echinata]|uniref:inositol polyphosphate multikinase-like isoform X1 n=2 Tax=Saccostrea echinata TaxID=191078 RepID=UPI002A7EBE57|nr:inositol polyphosphate multikinase-like isoform X1 [Saccostrea echinata]